MLVIAHAAHWLLEAGPLLVVPVVLLVSWLRTGRARRRAAGDPAAVARPPTAQPHPSGHLGGDRPPHA